MRLFLSEVDRYKAELALNIGELVGMPVTIGRLGANMRGFNPQLVLKDISLVKTGNEKPAIEFTEIRLGLHLLEMLANQDLLSSSWVTVVGAKLTIKRQADGRIVIVGIKASDGQPQWLLQGGKFEVLHSKITWLDETIHSQPMLFNEVDLAICNDGEHHRLNVLMGLPKKMGDTLRLSMDFKGNIFTPATVQGRVFIGGKSVLLAELDAFLPTPTPIHINAGTADLKIWADWQHSELVSVDISAHIQQMALVRQDKQALFVNQLKTHLHLANTADGANNRWQVDVNGFSLETQDNKTTVTKWPDAVFSVSGQR
jgi:uncharacterized protein YhdP